MPAKTVRVLLVEDDREWQGFFKKAFQGVAVVITTASSLEEARAALARDSFDIVVCDGSLTGSMFGDSQGHDLALELHRAGQKVAVFSTGQALHAGVPHFDKRECPEAFDDLVDWVLAS